MEAIYSNADTRRMRQLFEYNRRLNLKRNQGSAEISCICSHKEEKEQQRAK